MSDDVPLSAEEIIRRIQRGALEAELVAQQRPDGVALGESLAGMSQLLYDLVHATRSVAHLERGEDPDDSWTWAADDTSVAASDTAWVDELLTKYCAENDLKTLLFADTNPHRNTSAWGLGFLARCFHTATDHLAAISALVATSAHLRAPITLSRTVLEASATACYLADARVDRAERLRRSLNLRFSELKETANERAGDDPDGDEHAQISELIAFARSAGYVVAKYDPRGYMAPVILGENRRRADSVRLVVDEVLPNGLGLSMYRSMSAIAHSRDSIFLMPDDYQLPDKVKPWQRTHSVAWHTLPALLVIHELCVRLERFLGWDMAGTADMIETVAIHWSIGAGQQDAAIRASLGFE